MSLKNLVRSYKTKMTPAQYREFLSFVETSVDLNAKNTANFKSRDLAELQIKQLARDISQR